MANTKISQLTNLTTPTGSEEFVYAYNNANGKVTLNTMKSFVGGAGITTLNADANIWELTDGIYETEHDLYYITGETVPVIGATGSVKKQMLFVTSDGGGNGFFCFNSGHVNTNYIPRASYGYSVSSSQGICNQLGSRDWAFGEYAPMAMTGGIDSFQKDPITQVIDNISDGTNDLRVSTTPGAEPYPGVTYTIYINSVASGKTYSITLGNGVTNPFNITLPTSSNKKAIITVLITSTTTGIVTGCTIES